VKYEGRATPDFGFQISDVRGGKDGRRLGGVELRSEPTLREATVGPPYCRLYFRDGNVEEPLTLDPSPRRTGRGWWES
jgi:hypothetical protein